LFNGDSRFLREFSWEIPDSIFQSRQIPLAPPFAKGEKMESFIEGVQKSTPPFGKGRLGGISGKAFSKSYIDTIFEKMGR
jgi:hypothetical protein